MFFPLPELFINLVGEVLHQIFFAEMMIIFIPCQVNPCDAVYIIVHIYM